MASKSKHAFLPLPWAKYYFISTITNNLVSSFMDTNKTHYCYYQISVISVHWVLKSTLYFPFITCSCLKMIQVYLWLCFVLSVYVLICIYRLKVTFLYIYEIIYFGICQICTCSHNWEYNGGKLFENCCDKNHMLNCCFGYGIKITVLEMQFLLLW